MFLILLFTRGCVELRTMMRSEGRKDVTEKSSDTTGNRSRDRPTSSAATTPPQAPQVPSIWLNFLCKKWAVERKLLLDVDGRIILRWIFRKWEGVVRTGWSGFRIGTGGGHL
jgi:hypothetical protein